MGDFFNALQAILGFRETKDQRRMRETLERPNPKVGVPPMLKRPGRGPSLLGETPQQSSSYRDGSALMPPSLPLHPNPMGRVGNDQRRINQEAVNQPGAQVFDALPAPPLTEEEKLSMDKAARSKGGRFNWPVEVGAGSFPAETLFLGPQGASRKKPR